MFGTKYMGKRFKEVVLPLFKDVKCASKPSRGCGKCKGGNGPPGHCPRDISFWSGSVFCSHMLFCSSAKQDSLVADLAPQHHVPAVVSFCQVMLSLRSPESSQDFGSLGAFSRLLGLARQCYWFSPAHQDVVLLSESTVVPSSPNFKARGVFGPPPGRPRRGRRTVLGRLSHVTFLVHL